MKRLLVVALALVMLAVPLGVAVPAEGAVGGSLTGGVYLRDGSSPVFVYGEFSVAPLVSVGVDYYKDALGLSGWFGRDKGFYGEVYWDTKEGGSPETWEVGVWQAFPVTQKATVTGWVGVLSEWSGSRTRLSANAEAKVSIGDPLFVTVGAGTGLSGGDSKVIGWAGLGFDF